MQNFTEKGEKNTALILRTVSFRFLAGQTAGIFINLYPVSVYPQPTMLLSRDALALCLLCFCQHHLVGRAEQRI